MKKPQNGPTLCHPLGSQEIETVLQVDKAAADRQAVVVQIEGPWFLLIGKDKHAFGPREILHML